MNFKSLVRMHINRRSILSLYRRLVNDFEEVIETVEFIDKESLRRLLRRFHLEWEQLQWAAATAEVKDVDDEDDCVEFCQPQSECDNCDCDEYVKWILRKNSSFYWKMKNEEIETSYDKLNGIVLKFYELDNDKEDLTKDLTDDLKNIRR